MKNNYDLMNDFWKRVRSWNGFRQDQFVDVRQIDEWTVRFGTPDGLVGIYDGLRHITRVVFNNFDEMDEYWFNQEIACNIEHYMILMGYSIESLAADIEISPQTLYNYLNGKTSPRVDVLFKLAKVLDRKPDDLFYVESRYK